MSILSKTTEALNNSTAVVAPETDRSADDALLARIDEISQAVESGDVDLGEMRKHYTDTYGKDTSLDDDEIIRIIASVEDDNPPKVWAGLMREAEMTAADEAMEVSAETSHDVMTHAHNLGGKLAKDEKFVSSMNALMEANELTKRGEAIIFLKLEKDWTADDWSRVPLPGTKKGETGNAPYDKWSVKDHANEGKVIKYSFFDELAKTIPYFRDVLTALEDVSDVLKKEPELGNAAREEMRNRWTKPKQQAQKATLTTRKSRFLTTLKKACALRLKLQAVQALPGIKCQVLTEKQPDGSIEVIRTTAPIEVSHADKPSICATYSIGTFLKLNPDKALETSKGEADAMFGALDATLTRAPKQAKGGNAGAADKYPPVTSPDDFDSCISSLAHYADKKDNLLALRKWFKEGKPEEREEKVQAFGDAFLPLQQIWTGVRPVYEEMQERAAKEADGKRKSA